MFKWKLSHLSYLSMCTGRKFSLEKWKKAQKAWHILCVSFSLFLIKYIYIISSWTTFTINTTPDLTVSCFMQKTYSSSLYELLAAGSLGSCFPRLPISCLPTLPVQTGSDIQNCLHMSPCYTSIYTSSSTLHKWCSCLVYTMESFARLVSRGVQVPELL